MLKMKKVGPSARAKDAPLRQALRLEFAPALEALEFGTEGIQVAIPDGVEPTRFRSLLNAVSNRAGFTVSTELVNKTDKAGDTVMKDGKRIAVAVNVYKTGSVEPLAATAGASPGIEEEFEEEEEQAPPPPRAKNVKVPPVVTPIVEEDDDAERTLYLSRVISSLCDPLGGDDENDD